MIKSELVQKIAAQNPHLYHHHVQNVVNAVLTEIMAAMRRGDRVELRGFGAFSVKHRSVRNGRNPRTGPPWLWARKTFHTSRQAKKCASV